MQPTPSAGVNIQVDSFASSRSASESVGRRLLFRRDGCMPGGESASTIAATLGVSRATVYRVLADQAD
jgi:DNA invertase Pin-like site-specific DNA recombinase